MLEHYHSISSHHCMSWGKQRDSDSDDMHMKMTMESTVSVANDDLFFMHAISSIVWVKVKYTYISTHTKMKIQCSGVMISHDLLHFLLLYQSKGQSFNLSAFKFSTGPNKPKKNCWANQVCLLAKEGTMEIVTENE